MLLAQGDLTAALQAYHDSLAIAERLARSDPSNADWQKDLALAHRKLGDVLDTQGNLAEALQTYQDGLAHFCSPGQGRPQQYRLATPSLSLLREGRQLLAEQGNLTDALKTYRDGLTIAERLAKADPSNASWQRDLSTALGNLAGLLILARDYGTALEVADEAISLDPNQIAFYGNRASALMFLGRTDEARAIYLQYRGKTNVVGQKSWETLVLDDFAELRKTGLTHPLMDEIEMLEAGTPR